MPKDRPDTPPSPPAAKPKSQLPPDDGSPFQYVHDGGFARIMHEINASLLTSTYQAGKLMVVRARGGRVSLLLRSFEQPMGIAVHPSLESIALGTQKQIWTLAGCPDIAGQLDPPGSHDACFCPRQSHVTGDFRSHEIAYVHDDLWIVNTRFSCLCTLDPNYSFVPRWRPPFVSKLAAEDRCHLNGLAIENNKPRFVTALAESNQPQGWRDTKEKSGIVIHIPTGEIIATGLCMPHSPRIHQGNLYVLNSGQGELITIDPQTGKKQTIAKLPGYARGLAIHDHYAFVGLSKIRETATFGGLPIADRLNELQCAIHIIDLDTGQTAGQLQFQAGTEELFDIQILPNIIWPSIVGFQKETISGIFIAPPGAWEE